MTEQVKEKKAYKQDELAASKYNVHVAAFVKAGRLSSHSKTWVLSLVIVLFALLLGSPALYQMYVERHDPEGPQVFHLFHDMVLTPAERAQALRLGVDSLQQELAHAGWQDSGALAYDNVTQATLQLWQRAKILNRHMELDSTSPRMQAWTLVRNLGDNAKDSLQALRIELGNLANSLEVRAGIWPTLWRIGNSMVHETLFSSAYLRAWEHRSEESSRPAILTRPWMQMLRYKLFGDLGAKGVQGEGWSFYRPGVDYAAMPWVTSEDPVRTIVEFRDQLKAKGIELIVMPVPNKETIYPDRLTRNASPELAGLVGHGFHVLAELRANGIEVVDLYSAFREDRKQDKNFQDALYLKDDTHWCLRGLVRAAHDAALQVRAKPWFAGRADSINYQRKACTVMRDGDVIAMSKLPVANFFTYKLPFAGQEVECEQVYADSTTLYQDDFRKARVLILGDSFSRIYQTDAPRSAGWISHLAAELGEPVASLVSDGGASTLVREKLARKPGVLRGKKLVIWEFVERDYRFGDGGWKSIEIK